MKNSEQPDTSGIWHSSEETGGLSKRELLAAMEPFNEMAEDDTPCFEYKAEIVGRPFPVWNKKNAIECEKFDAEFRAKVRVMRADALLAELDQENVCEWQWEPANRWYELKCSEFAPLEMEGKYCPFCGRPIKEAR